MRFSNTNLASCFLFFSTWFLTVLDCTSLNIASAQRPKLQPTEVQSTSHPLVMVHYMPWFAAPPTSQDWGWHWTMNHFDPDSLTGEKRQIASHYDPLIGPYDSGDSDVLEYHLLTMKIAGIDGVIVDWYGLSNFRDYAMLHRNTTRLLQQCERLNMKFIICYEDQTIPALVDEKKLAEEQMVRHATEEINWLSQYWFKSGSYVKLDDRPVLLSFGHAGLNDQQWAECLSRLQSPVAYYSQDYCRPGAVGGFGWPAPRVGMQQVDSFLRDRKAWTDSIPVAFPRFNDIYAQAGVNEGYPQLPDHDGRTFQTTFQKALSAKSKIIQIATWNDWGEGTQVEPSHQFGFRDLTYLQNLTQQNRPQSERFIEADLKIPLEIFRKRKQVTADPIHLDELVQLIVGGKYEQLRRAAR